jgi:hypothetical protein
MKQHGKIAFLLAGLAGSALLFPAVQAQTFTYAQDADLLLGFRNLSANDYVVNLGSISSYSSLGAGTFPVTSYNAADLTTFLGGVNSLTLSISGGEADNTLWLSRARTDPDVQTTPWNRSLSILQGNTSSKISILGNNAVTYGASNPAGANNTLTAIVEPDSAFASPSLSSYSEVIGASGNYGGSFPGNIEGTTGASFSSGSAPLRLDLYQIVAGSGPSTFVGSFDFNPNGSMTFTAVPEPNTVVMIVVTLACFGLARRLQKASDSRSPSQRL